MSIIINKSAMATRNANLPQLCISTLNISTTATCNILTIVTNSLSTTTINSNTVTKFSYNNIWKLQIQMMVVYQLISSLTNQPSGLCQWNSGTGYNQNPSSQNYLSLLVIPEDTASSKQETNQKPLIRNIPSAASTKDESLVAIFLFELKKITSVLLFSGATLDTKPITTMYTDAKVNGQYIKLILNSGSAGNIITKQLIDQLADRATKTFIGKIDDFPFEVNNIIVPIKVLVIEATQYQALVDNNWLTKTNAILDWTMQKLQLSQNGQHTHILAMCGHFKTINTSTSLIEFEKEEEKPTWEAYQRRTYLENHHQCLNQQQPKQGKKKKKTYLEKSNQQKTQPKDEQIHTPFANKDYWTQTHYYCKLCHCECYEYPKHQDKWDNKSCLTCSKQLLDEGMWNNISGRGGIYNTLC
ncbi:hypothetical protein G9A89_008866 [Geosiphon pyriformis]|nr:hypothetical protein G9A89_008866 [Geosiphon pyriformis]